MSNEQKARELIVQAQKKLTSYSWFSSKSAKFEDAAELYVKAANLFKIARKNREAGDAFKEAANCYLNFSKYEAAQCYVKASHSLKKEDPQAAIASLQSALDLYTDEGKFGMAAKFEKEIAELMEGINDIENSMKHYETAADYFESENSPSAANNCLLKVAQFAADLKQFSRAYALFEQVAESSVSNQLLKWSVKEYFLKAGLCRLSEGDIVGTKKALQRYCSLSPEFSSTRECTLLTEITEAMENYDIDAFTNAVQEFDSVTKLDQWKTSMLVDLKDKMEKEDHEEDLT